MTFIPADRSTNLAIWIAMWLTLLSWQAATATRTGLPSIALVVQLLRRWWPTRWLLLIGWAWLGWHLFVRTTF